MWELTGWGSICIERSVWKLRPACSELPPGCNHTHWHVERDGRGNRVKPAKRHPRPWDKRALETDVYVESTAPATRNRLLLAKVDSVIFCVYGLELLQDGVWDTLVGVFGLVRFLGEVGD